MNMISLERLEQMKTLLLAMGNRNKLAADGLGIYLGDGIPRPGLGSLRSNELADVIDELIQARSPCR